MSTEFRKAVVCGVERLRAWSDMLDSLNVFPVPDRDTGRNLSLTLAPLMGFNNREREETIHQIIRNAYGNAGNIAAQFFAGFLLAESGHDFYQAACRGRNNAWRAVQDPKPGTMLTVFDALTEVLQSRELAGEESFFQVSGHLEEAVRGTRDCLPELRQCGVVDAGALGAFIFLETFVHRLVASPCPLIPVNQKFQGLARSPGQMAATEQGYCVNATLQSAQTDEASVQRLAEWGDNLVLSSDEGCLSVHVHTSDIKTVRQHIQSLGQLVSWSEEDLSAQVASHATGSSTKLHIMTDAAGSLTREDSRNYGFTLLDSYILDANTAYPETLCSSARFYEHMKSGVAMSTSQASVHEREQHYQSVLSQYETVLYLCVGSAYTGNYKVAKSWLEENGFRDRMRLIDTGAASGRLGLSVLATACYARNTQDVEDVVRFARDAILNCREYIFLDKLLYLAKGGRLSRTSAFFGDLMHMKPVVSPTEEGAVKVGVARNERNQLQFAREGVQEVCGNDTSPLIMLEYTDNQEWVESVACEDMAAAFPAAKIMLQPMSLTSAAHMGPGTWGISFLPERVGLFFQ